MKLSAQFFIILVLLCIQIRTQAQFANKQVTVSVGTDVNGWVNTEPNLALQIRLRHVGLNFGANAYFLSDASIYQEHTAFSASLSYFFFCSNKQRVAINKQFAKGSIPCKQWGNAKKNNGAVFMPFCSFGLARDVHLVDYKGEYEAKLIEEGFKAAFGVRVTPSKRVSFDIGYAASAQHQKVTGLFNPWELSTTNIFNKWFQNLFR